MDKIIIFLAQNPWLLALATLSALWPVVRGTWRVYRRLDNWLVTKIRPEPLVAERAADNPSYFISVVLNYAFYVGLLFCVRYAAYLLMDAIRQSPPSNGSGIATFLLGFLLINTAILIGLNVGAVLQIVLHVRNHFEKDEQK